MAIIGIDLGGTKIAAALFDEQGNQHTKINRLLEGAAGDEVGDKVIETINALKISNPGINIEGVGICVPGIVYGKTDTVWAPNIPGWDNYPLKNKIIEALGDPMLPVKIETDRTCYILGEMWRGAARDCDNAIYLAVGTGIGAGMLIDGRVLHGAQDIAGATGWMALQYPYTEEYIPVGCFEYYASGNGIATQARRALRCARNYTGMLSQKPIDEITSYDVFEGYKQGDHIATKVLEKAIEMWGMGTSNLVSLFNPEKVIFGGGVFGPAKQFIRRIYDEACKWGQPIAMQSVEYCASGVEGEAALLGAAYSVICPA